MKRGRYKLIFFFMHPVVRQGWKEYMPRVRENFPQVDMIWAKDGKEMEKEIGDAEIIVGGRISVELFRKAKKLRWFHQPGVGIEHLLFPEMMESAVILTNGRGVHAIPMAEHALGMMICFARKLDLCIRKQSQGKPQSVERWQGDEIYPLREPGYGEIFEQTLGIIGLGGVGTELAKRAKCMGMKVIALKRRPSVKPKFVDRLLFREDLPKLLHQSDYLVIACPLTRETKSMIGDEELRSMKRTAVLVNIARGNIIREESLLQALERGWIRGACLDVGWGPPIPRDHSLYQRDDVIISPHISGFSRRMWERGAKLLQNNLSRFLKGEKLLSVVDKERGY